LLVVPVAAPANVTPADRRLTFSQTIDQDVQALAVSPVQVPPNITLQAEAILPNGTRTPIIRLITRADWARRYWFEKPIAMPRGTKIEVVAKRDDRIDPNRAARRQVDADERDGGEQQRRRREDERIARRDAEQQIRDDACQAERRRQADHQSDHCQTHALTDHHPPHVACVGAKGEPDTDFLRALLDR